MEEILWTLHPSPPRLAPTHTPPPRLSACSVPELGLKPGVRTRVRHAAACLPRAQMNPPPLGHPKPKRPLRAPSLLSARSSNTVFVHGALVPLQSWVPCVPGMSEQRLT